MINYEILHHVPGRIRIAVPLLKKLSFSALAKLASIPLADGILTIEPNYLSFNLVIRYDPRKIDILAYMRTLASDPEIEKIVKGDAPESESPAIQS
jgi:hypothetical protein